MDEAVIRYYRRLLKTGFEHAGSFESASIFLDAIGERAINCGDTDNFVELYVNVVSNTIEDMRYLCSCEPTTNVAVEVLCALVKGKTLDQIADVTEEDFSRFIGSKDEELREKAKGLLGLLEKGVARYKSQTLPDSRQEAIAERR